MKPQQMVAYILENKNTCKLYDFFVFLPIPLYISKVFEIKKTDSTLNL